MTDLDLNEFETGQQLRSTPERRVMTAIRGDSGESVQLTVFSAKVSLCPEFRRAVKMDRAMLAMLQHQSIISFLGCGESEGALFFCTEASDFIPLSEQLTTGRCFAEEDIIEIGWQICSALQMAHNLGLAHGGLSADSVLLSDNLQVTVVDFGVARWLRAAAAADDNSSKPGLALVTISALASRQDVEQDLRDLASLLTQLVQVCSDAGEPDVEKITTRAMLERLLARFEKSGASGAAQRPGSAREFQGRLGEMLIGTGDDAMSLVDQRNTVGTSRRSIVVELFEPTESSPRSDATSGESANFAWRRQILPIMIGIAALIILWLLAGRLR